MAKPILYLSPGISSYVLNETHVQISQPFSDTLLNQDPSPFQGVSLTKDGLSTLSGIDLSQTKIAQDLLNQAQDPPPSGVNHPPTSEIFLDYEKSPPQSLESHTEKSQESVSSASNPDPHSFVIKGEDLSSHENHVIQGTISKNWMDLSSLNTPIHIQFSDGTNTVLKSSDHTELALNQGKTSGTIHFGDDSKTVIHFSSIEKIIV